MDSNDMHPWNDWRENEAGGRPDEADRAFAALAKGWARADVPAGLAARIARAASTAPVRGGFWASGWVQAQAAAAVVVTGAVLAGLSTGSLGSLFLASFQTVAGGVGAVLRWADACASAAGAIGRPLVQIVGVLADVMVEPVPLLVLGINVALASAALAVLRRVLTVREV
jgi:hypothetical protein